MWKLLEKLLIIKCVIKQWRNRKIKIKIIIKKKLKDKKKEIKNLLKKNRKNTKKVEVIEEIIE